MASKRGKKLYTLKYKLRLAIRYLDSIRTQSEVK